jgi:hypothetical protein
MSGNRTITLTPNDYEAIYRILITSSVESLAEQRNLNDVLEAFEKAGEAIGIENGNGVPRMFTINGDTSIELTRLAAETLRDHCDRGIGRFQSWAVRGIPAVLDRLESRPN